MKVMVSKHVVAARETEYVLQKVEKYIYTHFFPANITFTYKL
jgi:hypothetical protein